MAPGQGGRLCYLTATDEGLKAPSSAPSPNASLSLLRGVGPSGWASEKTERGQRRAFWSGMARVGREIEMRTGTAAASELGTDGPDFSHLHTRAGRSEFRT